MWLRDSCVSCTFRCRFLCYNMTRIKLHTLTGCPWWPVLLIILSVDHVGWHGGSSVSTAASQKQGSGLNTTEHLSTPLEQLFINNRDKGSLSQTNFSSRCLTPCVSHTDYQLQTDGVSSAVPGRGNKQTSFVKWVRNRKYERERRNVRGTEKTNNLTHLARFNIQTNNQQQGLKQPCGQMVECLTQTFGSRHFNSWTGMESLASVKQPQLQINMNTKTSWNSQKQPDNLHRQNYHFHFIVGLNWTGMNPIALNYTILGSKWTVSYWSWCVGSRLNGQA